MEAGVHGEHGVHVSRRVVVLYWKEIDHVAVHHLQRVVLIVKETTMKRHRLLQSHVVFIFFLLLLFHKVLVCFVLWEQYSYSILYLYTIPRQDYIITLIIPGLVKCRPSIGQSLARTKRRHPACSYVTLWGSLHGYTYQTQMILKPFSSQTEKGGWNYF
jgi:hypothetical protein